MPRYWVIVPAAGSGKRMGSAQPKQYLPLLDRTVLEWALRPFLTQPRFAAVVVALAADDRQFEKLLVSGDPRVRRVPGGAERADSVRAGLAAIAADAAADDWVLVHDAARPCLAASDLETLIQTLADDEIGGLLATPVSDTLKRADAEQRVAATLARDGIWRALTPQMFRYGVLLQALDKARANAQSVTDEASAVELLGHAPRLIAGRSDNIKITVAEDLLHAANILLAMNLLAMNMSDVINDASNE